MYVEGRMKTCGIREGPQQGSTQGTEKLKIPHAGLRKREWLRKSAGLRKNSKMVPLPSRTGNASGSGRLAEAECVAPERGAAEPETEASSRTQAAASVRWMIRHEMTAQRRKLDQHAKQAPDCSCRTSRESRTSHRFLKVTLLCNQERGELK